MAHTAEETTKILQLRSATGFRLHHCRQLLQKCNWDIEEAKKMAFVGWTIGGDNINMTMLREVERTLKLLRDGLNQLHHHEAQQYVAGLTDGIEAHLLHLRQGK